MWGAAGGGGWMRGRPPAGAPALSAARRTTFTVSKMQFTARGWGEKMMGLPAFIQIMDL